MNFFNLSIARLSSRRIIPYIIMVSAILIISCNAGGDRDEKPVTIFTQSPPMGWNSFDAYDCRINEAEFRANVDYMAENLKQHGWEYAVIDYVWWHPEPGNWKNRRYGHPNIRYKSKDGEPLYPEYTTMDEYGRLLPSVERFPSSADGMGFKPLADYVHEKGLKFGIHIMRGIHRYAYFQNTPVKGTDYTARQVGELWDTCNWCNHMFGVDYSKPGAQEYYNSLFELYAEWEVDFIKADDMMTPKYHAKEIEMMKKAIENSGRPMVLSLSCGLAPIAFANHVNEYSTMWRISSDFWDHWSRLERNFDLFNQWSPFIGNGSWPDGDMLPVGRLSLQNRPHGQERQSHFTWDEQYTLINLWSIAKSPLILGADLVSMDDSTLALLTNDEVIYVNQQSTGNHQVRRTDSYAIWIGEDPENGDRFLALFNLSDEKRMVSFNMEYEHLRGNYRVRDLWTKTDMETVQEKFSVELPAHGSGMYRFTKKD